MPLQNTGFPPAPAELYQIVVNKKIPNALLFTGKPGTGRKQAAFWFAKALNCASDRHPPCNRCRSCKKIDSRMHPDMVVVGLPDKKKIVTISQIREMEALIAARSHEARYRMVLISHAGHMNIQAQNALLKALEEPDQGTFFVLLARDSAPLLPTIKSRVRLLQFRPLTGAALADHLCTSFSAEPRAARIAAATAGSDLKLALTLLNMPGRPERTDERTGQASPAPQMDWQAGRIWIMQQLSGLVSGTTAERIPKALYFSWQLGLDTERIVPGLAVMRSFFRDVCVFRHAPEKIVNLDFLAVFEDICPQVDDSRCLAWMTALHETEQRMDSNSSVRMAMDRFLLRITQI